jgi:D-alanyl-D-alanine carboxypeptidase
LQTSDHNEEISRKTRRPADHQTPAAFFFPLGILLFILALAGLFWYTSRRVDLRDTVPVSPAEADLARSVWEANAGAPAGHSDAPELSALCWNGKAGITAATGDDLAVNARSAILVDVRTGSVLYEKDADDAIPPASMTKLVAMYTAFRAAGNGEISFDDIVDLPPESWAVNIPAGSSLMFLGEGQKVTVRELLRGMAVASGNDAAIALACHVSGSVAAFVARMNGEMERLGLSQTRFVEPSGLSERNLTTAREFADFALVYIREYPEALKAFHSVTRLEYPMPWNLPAGQTGAPVEQYATNKLLGNLPGCDGLKTGFIVESGYNLSLTAERDGTRFLSVTMGGPGASTAEGNMLRTSDGRTLMEWAFGNFRTVRPETAPVPVPLTVWGGRVGKIEALPATGADCTVPAGMTGRLACETVLPRMLEAPVAAGDVVGRIDYSVGGTLLRSVPLVADRNSAHAGIAVQIIDAAARLVSPVFR